MIYTASAITPPYEARDAIKLAFLAIAVSALLVVFCPPVSGEPGVVDVSYGDGGTAHLESDTVVFSPDEGHYVESVSLVGLNLYHPLDDLLEINKTQRYYVGGLLAEYPDTEQISVEFAETKHPNVTVLVNPPERPGDGDGTARLFEYPDVSAATNAESSLGAVFRAETGSVLGGVFMVNFDGTTELRLVEENGYWVIDYVDVLPKMDNLIQVVFDRASYIVVANVGSNPNGVQGGTADPIDQEVKHGDSAKVHLVPDEGFEIESVKINKTYLSGAELSEARESWFVEFPVYEDTSVDVWFSEGAHFMFRISDGGTVSWRTGGGPTESANPAGNDDYVVPFGTTVVLDITPDEAYRIG